MTKEPLLSPEQIILLAHDICRAVAENPNHSSPEERPDLLLVTDQELFNIVQCRLEHYADNGPYPYVK